MTVVQTAAFNIRLKKYGLRLFIMYGLHNNNNSNNVNAVTHARASGEHVTGKTPFGNRSTRVSKTNNTRDIEKKKPKSTV